MTGTRHQFGYSRSAARVREYCASNNIKIEKRGVAFAVTGPGVSLLCADLAMLTEEDLAPVRNRTGGLPERKERMI